MELCGKAFPALSLLRASSRFALKSGVTIALNGGQCEFFAQLEGPKNGGPKWKTDVPMPRLLNGV